MAYRDHDRALADRARIVAGSIAVIRNERARLPRAAPSTSPRRRKILGACLAVASLLLLAWLWRPQPAPAREHGAVTITWDGQVLVADGCTLPLESACSLALHTDGRTVADASLVCDGRTVYQNADLDLPVHLDERPEPGEAKAYRYAVRWSAVPHRWRDAMSVSSPDEQALVWGTDGCNVEVRLHTWSVLRHGLPLAPRDP
jgi:hypothetical protein